MKLKNVKEGQRVRVKDVDEPATGLISCADYGLNVDHCGTIISSELSPLGNVLVQFDDHDGREYGAMYTHLLIKADNLRKVK